MEALGGYQGGGKAEDGEREGAVRGTGRGVGIAGTGVAEAWYVASGLSTLLVLTSTLDLLILGLGKDMRPISPKTRQRISSLGIRIDIQDTRNAAAQFNLLATERGVGNVAAALIPLGWQEGLGVK